MLFLLTPLYLQTDEAALALVEAYLAENSLEDRLDELNAALEEEFGEFCALRKLHFCFCPGPHN